MSQEVIGFVGLGVMGEPMARHLVQKSGHTVVGSDRQTAPLDRLERFGLKREGSVEAVAKASDIVFLSLPSGAHVLSVCQGNEGLLANSRSGQIIVDLGTSPVSLSRELAQKFAERGVHYADAPIARTRQAAEEGTLSVMVGCSDDIFARIQPLLACFASDVTHCGAVGAGQTVKILNNMVLVETVVALSEAIEVARRAGLEGEVLFKTLMRGSADSFALRNHGMKAILADNFPERAFSTDYARKDISYALDLASSVGMYLEGASTADSILARASAAGYGDQYWPVISKVIGIPSEQPVLAKQAK